MRILALPTALIGLLAVSVPAWAACDCCEKMATAAKQKGTGMMNHQTTPTTPPNTTQPR